jgi:hypothetical protein
MRSSWSHLAGPLSSAIQSEKLMSGGPRKYTVVPSNTISKDVRPRYQSESEMRSAVGVIHCLADFGRPEPPSPCPQLADAFSRSIKNCTA